MKTNRKFEEILHAEQMVRIEKDAPTRSERHHKDAKAKLHAMLEALSLEEFREFAAYRQAAREAAQTR